MHLNVKSRCGRRLR